MRETRTVVVTIESLLEIVKDYVRDQVPADAKAVKLMFNPQERKIAIVTESSEWKEGECSPVMVKFELRRVYSV